MVTFPLSLNPEETFSITILGVVYNCRQQWNTLGYWTLSFSDVDNLPIVLGVAIVAGLDILAPHPSLPFGLRLTTDTELTRENVLDLTLEVTAK